MLNVLAGCVLLAGPATVDVRVDGPGLLRFIRDGRTVYAKETRLSVASGRLSGPEGAATLPGIVVGAVPDSFAIRADGSVIALYAGRERTLGRLSLAVFDDERDLTRSGGFWISSSRPKTVWPGTFGAGTLVGAGLAGETLPTVPQHSAQATRPPSPQPNPASKPAAKPGVKPDAKPAAKPDAKPAAKPPTASSTYLRPGATRPPQVEVRDLTEVEKQQYTLGDIARIEGEPTQVESLRAVVLGDTPPLGIERIIDRTRLDARLRAVGLNPSKLALSIPIGARVVRKGQRIPHATLVAKAIEGVRAKLGAAGDLIPAGDGPELILPVGELRLTTEAVTTAGSRVTAIVAGYVNGVRIKSRAVELVRSNLPVAMRVGQTVKVRLRANGVALETTGRVVRVGQPGEPVVVQTGTGAELSGKPDVMGVVEVEL